MPNSYLVEPLDVLEGVRRAKHLFQKHYNYVPAGVWSAPGYCSLIGEYTAPSIGQTFAVALNHKTFVALAPRKDNVIRIIRDDSFRMVTATLDSLERFAHRYHASSLQHSETHYTDSHEQISHEQVAHSMIAPSLTHHYIEPINDEDWAAYVCGLAQEFQRRHYKISGFDVAVVSCIPKGLGLGSTSALTSAVALAIDDVFHIGFGALDVGRLYLAQLAVCAEREFVGSPVTGVGQYVAFYAEPNCGVLVDCEAVELLQRHSRQSHALLESADGEFSSMLQFQGIHLKDCDIWGGQAEIVIASPKISYQLNAAQCQERLMLCSQAMEMLGLHDFHALYSDFQYSLDDIVSVLPPAMQASIRHSVTEIERVENAVEAMGNRDVAVLGRMISQSDDSFRKDSLIQAPVIDRIVAHLQSYSCWRAVQGSRMSLGSFGNSLIAVVLSQGVPAILNEIATMYDQEQCADAVMLLAIPGERATCHARFAGV